MSITDKDWQEEQQRVDSVTGKIRKRIQRLEAETGQVKSEVLNIRKHFWDDVTVNLSNPDDVTETYFSMKQQADVLAERERSHRHSFSALKKLTRLVQSPYFGRIDFTEKGFAKTEQVYLGISSFLDDDEETFLVFDWRAPISSLYYDFSPGEVTYQTPGDEVSGTMSLKRQYVIRDGNIRFMFDTGVTIGDELLQQVLSRNSDAHMKSIVATIQKEQNRIIRNDRGRMLIVQGAAGSGKTSAALQRVAYLLYKYRQTLHAGQIVLFSPNPLFNSYISTVLPELGEENMQQTTFQEYLEHRLGKEFQIEDPFAQLEYILTSEVLTDYKARISGIRYKSSSNYLKVISDYINVLEQEGMIFKSIKFRGRVIVKSTHIKERFYSFEPTIRLTNRIILLRDWLLEEISAIAQIELQGEWVEEQMNLLDNENYQRAYKHLRRMQKGRGATFDDFDKEKEILAQMIVDEHLKPVRKRIKQLRFVDVPKIYRQLFIDKQLFYRISGEANFPEYWPEICEQTIQKLDQSILAYEDATPFLYLKELIQGFQTNTSVRHVFVDEAQDYSPFQFEFLKRLFPRSKMTVLGDINQGIYAHAPALQNFDSLVELYGSEQTEIIRLTQSYRSTREIVQFTRGMVPRGEAVEPFNRSGDKPKVIKTLNEDDLNRKIVDDIETLQKDGYESIAVICKTAKESKDAYETLNQKLSLHLITKHTLTFEKGTFVIPFYLAKGVEFDAVIIYNGSKEKYSHERERKLFYTACTRAMHLLHIYSIGEVSPFVTEQNPDTYTLEIN